jgi:hypothetical protein
MTHMLVLTTMLTAGCSSAPLASPQDAGSCTSDQECAAPTGVCDLAGTMTCVQCTPAAATACTGATPACVSNSCAKCTAHTQCAASNVCLLDGSCALATQVAYVQAGGTGALPCAKDAPCGTLDDGVKANQPTVKVGPGTLADNKVTTIDGKAVTIVADPGAKLSRSNAGVILQVQNTGADVAIYDLEITAGAGAGNPAISLPAGGEPKLSLTRVAVDGNQGTGISVAAGSLSITQGTITNNGSGIVMAGGGTLSIAQSTISGNTGGGVSATGGTLSIAQSTISGNTGGGVSATGGTLSIAQSTVTLNTSGGISISGAQFDITNIFIVSNGGAGSILGGIRIDGVTTNGMHRLDFNTLTANQGPATINTGITCGTVLVPLVFANNIVYANIVSGGGVQVGGGGANCAARYSNIGPDTLPGTGNINVDPLFVNVPQANFHLQATSPARDVADPAATLTVDFDGDVRPQGTRTDMGADEWQPSSRWRSRHLRHQDIE